MREEPERWRGFGRAFLLFDDSEPRTTPVTNQERAAWAVVWALIALFSALAAAAL
jgi:hypothetical protein